MHDLDSNDPESSIVAIENGQVTGRKVGDGPSHVVLETLRGDREKLQDHLCYLTKTKDGKILKSTTIYIRNDDGTPIGIFGINYDITLMLAMENISASLPLRRRSPGSRRPSPATCPTCWTSSSSRASSWWASRWR